MVEIILATESDINSILRLIEMRIKWMDQQGIEQWNKSKYLESHTQEYFRTMINMDRLFIARTKSELIVGSFTLSQKDERWNDNQEALYIHNFVSHTSFSGIGDLIIAFCEEQASLRNISFLRIDCQKTNEKLNNYYENRGFRFISSFDEELYSGNRREKTLNVY